MKDATKEDEHVVVPISNLIETSIGLPLPVSTPLIIGTQIISDTVNNTAASSPEL